jgi:hypothetical protein
MVMEDNRSAEVKRAKMTEIMRPIEQQMLLCESPQDKAMMACALLAVAKDLLDKTVGEEGRAYIFRGFTQ